MLLGVSFESVEMCFNQVVRLETLLWPDIIGGLGRFGGGLERGRTDRWC